MERSLTLHVPDEVFEPLAETAKREGKSPENLAIEWLRTVILGTSHDPVEEFIGTFHSDLPDWTDRHEALLGHVSMEEMSGCQQG